MIISGFSYEIASTPTCRGE